MSEHKWVLNIISTSVDPLGVGFIRLTCFIRLTDHIGLINLLASQF